MADRYYGYDDERVLFKDKPHVNKLADTLAPLLGINRRSLAVEGKRGEFHLYNAYVQRYFTPKASTLESFDEELQLHKRLVKEAMG